MVVVIEPVCHGWMHEEVNAGLLKLISNTTDEDVFYIGEEEHSKCVSKIYHDNKVRYIRLVDIKRDASADSYNSTSYYYGVLDEVWRKYHPTYIFIACAYRPCILASELFFASRRKCKCYIVLHGMVEKSKGNEDSYYKLFKMSRLCNNLKFITYSPYCTGEYWKLGKEKIIFIHHPYIKAEMHNEGCTTKKIIIGVIGACANNKALSFIKKINKKNIGGKYEFWVASRFGRAFWGIPNVKILDLSFDRRKMEKQIQQMDYILLPYGKNEYTISASGVLWDAVSNRVPCLMLDCKYFEYYMSHKIGYQAKNIAELCDIFEEKVLSGSSKGDQYYVGLDELDMYNKKIMGDLLR